MSGKHRVSSGENKMSTKLEALKQKWSNKVQPIEQQKRSRPRANAMKYVTVFDGRAIADDDSTNRCKRQRISRAAED